MYSNTPNAYSTHQPDHGRQNLPHSHSQPFVVAGMGGPGVSNSPGLRTGALAASTSGQLGMGMGDSLSQSRAHYQPGYLMSASQNNNASQSPRFDDAPIVPTKAKMNPLLAGTSASEFGMDSMFQSSRQRQRQTMIDEDAPPMASVTDIVTEVYEPGPRRQAATAVDSPRPPTFRQTQGPSTPKPSTPPSTNKPLYVIVFGYPPDKYSITAEYFRSLGESTEPDLNLEISNCFRIGYANPAEAMRAVRKNGDVLGGSFMIGVKWADPALAEALIGSPVARSPLGGAPVTSADASPDVAMSDASPTRGFAAADSSMMLGALVQRTQTPPVGTPIKLAPSASAFRKPGTGSRLSQQKLSESTPGGLPPSASGMQATPGKGVLGQVSDLIFGW